jgi:hypothetical protein
MQDIKHLTLVLRFAAGLVKIEARTARAAFAGLRLLQPISHPEAFLRSGPFVVDSKIKVPSTPLGE